ncbi:MAG: hypothetical protein J6U77_08555, partial [Verrucomicrobia bacterium]|nr:hypothetical protein [Verrucomicrobiota bacterium]
MNQRSDHEVQFIHIVEPARSCSRNRVFLAVSALSAQEWVPGELLIKTKPGVTSAQLDSLNKTLGV